MRMLNYSRDTNPFHRSLVGIPSNVHVTSQQRKWAPKKSSNEEDCNWVKRRLKKQPKLHAFNSRRARVEHFLTNQSVASKPSEFSNKTFKPAGIEIRAQAKPPSTVFASLDDMDFMDSSTLSDDICSVLSQLSRTNPFQVAVNDLAEQAPSKTKPFSRKPAVGTKSNGKNQNAGVSSKEVVTKGKLSGMTLADALTRRRNITDGEKIVIENCNYPCRSLKSNVDRQSLKGPDSSVYSAQSSSKKAQDSNSNASIHYFLSTRNKLKKIPTNNLKVSETKENDQSVIEVASISESYLPASKGVFMNTCMKKDLNSSSASTCTATISTDCSMSNRIQDLLEQSEGTRSDSSHKTKLTSQLGDSLDTTEPEIQVNLSTERAQDKRDDVEDDVRSSTSVHETTQNSEKYNKMLKLGVPYGAVQNAMKRDRVDPSTIQLDCDKISTESTPPAETFHSETDSEIVPQKKNQTSTNVLVDSEKYEKMLKLGIPLGAVHNAIHRDGVASLVSFKNTITSCKARGKQKDPFRRTRLHWTSLKHDQFTEKSIWNAIKKDKDVGKLDTYFCI